ncbi:G/U mismatch-specific DNA glycosylase [Haloechinothrix sp. YIM 98757]|uniref:G/U mismatch-specific DNA glycosylase n=1 Tax=Haloechinothrix aidingensis TaxID=2752311 RepID=A0A838A475_9PSEU|nr:G/U mismatch-specific DNA glycosylase [Haloechinothrix aidingensis]MBA0124390.1 G/U mismatch-specific DNA glycosylase [Haloechinothrix aidingensis]
MTRPTREDLEAARDKTIPDVIAADLDVLFCGINPGLYSGATGFHFARPGNRFWPALHQAGFTPRQLRPAEQDELLSHGVGITNLVARTTALADELREDELRDGAERLARLAGQYRPLAVAVVGISAYRVAFARPKARVGRQPHDLDGAALWALPNPSGLNAHYQLPALAAEFRAIRQAGATGERSR